MQGELFRAHAHIKPRRADFFAHEAQQRGDVETDNTSARPQQGSLETDITSAPKNCTKNTHFSPAKATTVSIEAQPAPAKATAVSDNRPTWPTGPGCGAHGQQRHHRLPNFAHNFPRSFFETPQKHCNSNDAHSMFEKAAGELRAKLMGGRRAWPDNESTRQATRQHTRPHWCGGCRRDRRARLRCPRAAGPSQATHRHPDRLEAAARPAGPGRASSRRAERSSRRGRRAGGQATRRPEICRGNKHPVHAKSA